MWSVLPYALSQEYLRISGAHISMSGGACLSGLLWHSLAYGAMIIYKI